MKLIDVETVYGTFAPNVRYTERNYGTAYAAAEAYNIENVITAIKTGVKIIMLVSVYTENHQTMLTDDAVYIVENGYTL